MKTKGKITPTKPVSFSGLIGGAIFTIIGLIIVLKVVEKDGGFGFWFAVAWTFGAGIATVLHAYNLFSDEPIATQEVQYSSISKTQNPSTRSRLEELKELKESGLISTDEYESKRSQLLNQL